MCGTDGDCGANGLCEPQTSYCSFPDAMCPSGRRYGSLAGGGFGNECVEQDEGSTSTSTMPMPSTSNGGGSLPGTTTMMPSTDTTSMGGSTSSSDSSSGTDTDTDLPPLVACDPEEIADTKQGVFVRASFGSDDNSGTAGEPLRTIQAGVALATELRLPNVYVAPGTYEESLSFDDSSFGLNIVAGWGVVDKQTWMRNCDPDAYTLTEIHAPANSAVLEVGPSAAFVRVDMFTLRASAGLDGPDAAPGTSSYGVRVQANSWLRLMNSDVLAGSGGDAGPTPKAPEPAPANECVGIGDCDEGLDGLEGSQGMPASAGTFDASGYVPAQGGDGADGDAGENGVPGMSGETTQGCTTDCVQSGVQCFALLGAVTAGTGRCGCGGGPGQGGIGGAGGGASVGVFAEGDALVELLNARVTARDGGDGAAGSEGSPSSAPTVATSGDDATCLTAGSCESNSPFPGCSPDTTETQTVLGGPQGGNGGEGGNGGRGGSGAGGPSCALVAIDGATIDAPEIIVTVGEHGDGSARGTYRCPR